MAGGDSQKLFALRVMFFLSGATGLTFETLWVRQFANVFGSTSVAMAWVFGTFILCLSIGGIAASRTAFAPRTALRVYGGMEAIIGVTGLALTVATLRYDIELAKLVYVESPGARLLIQILVTFVLIGIPAGMMGATFPVLMSALRSGNLPEREVTVLYGLNMVGGAAGAFATGYFLLWIFGVTGTAWLAFFVTLGLMAAAWLLSGSYSSELSTGSESVDDGASPSKRKASIGRSFLALAFLSGFTSIGYEILWGRVSRLYFGERSVATATLLCIYLLSMALGSLSVKWVVQKAKQRPSYSIQTTVAAFLAGPAILHVLALAGTYAVLANPSMAEALTANVPVRIALAFFAMVLPVAFLGMAFPFVLQASPGINEAPARVVGWLYFVNSIGSFLGAMYGGYLAPKLIGTVNGFLLLSVLLLGVGVALLLRKSQSRNRQLIAGSLVLSLVGVALLAPNDLYFTNERESIVVSSEDEYGIHVIVRQDDGQMIGRNYATYSSYFVGTQYANRRQELPAYLGCMLAKSCDRFLNIGTGYGTTIGAMVKFNPRIAKSIETVELNPFVHNNQSAFSKFNFHYWNDSRVKSHLTDGRWFLSTSKETYDIISVNPTDMYVPGSSTFFGQDFWRLAESKLNPGGTYVQLLWGPHKAELFKGLEQVFGTVLPVTHSPGFTASIGMKGLTGNPDISFYAICMADNKIPHLSENRMNEEIELALREAGVPNGLEFLRSRVEVASALLLESKTALREVQPIEHTDDRPLLEYLPTTHGTSFDSEMRFGTGAATRDPWASDSSSPKLYPASEYSLPHRE